jgi:hypothetical protein
MGYTTAQSGIDTLTPDICGIVADEVALAETLAEALEDADDCALMPLRRKRKRLKS